MRESETEREGGFVTKSGKLAIPAICDDVLIFRVAPVKLGGKWGYINRSGEVVIPSQFTQARGFCDGIAGVNTDSGWTLICKNGKFVFPKTGK